DRHHEIIGAAGDGVGRVADGLAAGGAHVLQPSDWLVRDLERLGEHEPGDAAGHGAEPVGVDLLRVDAGRLVRVASGVDEQVVGPLVPLLAEGRAAHADDGDAILDAVAGHASLLRFRYSAPRGGDATALGQRLRPSKGIISRDPSSTPSRQRTLTTALAAPVL